MRRATSPVLMPPEAVLVPPRSVAWRAPLWQLALTWAALIALTWNDWSEMARQWWNASTYNHILLVPLVLAWLVRQRWSELAKLAPRAWWPGLAILAGGVLVWLAGTALGINTASQLGAVIS